MIRVILIFSQATICFDSYFKSWSHRPNLVLDYRESHQKYSLGTVSNIIILGGGGGGGLNQFNGPNLRFCCDTKHLVSCLDRMVIT